MSANIISYHKLLDTHVIKYNSHTDTFSAVPTSGPTLTFHCANGHYVLDLATVAHAYAIAINPKAFKYSASSLALVSPTSLFNEWDTSVIKLRQRSFSEAV